MKTIKVCIVGPKGCGKTSMLKAFLGMDFEECPGETLNAYVYRCRCARYILDFWDCPDWLDQNCSNGTEEDFCSGANIVIHCFKESSRDCLAYLEPSRKGKVNIICKLQADIPSYPMEHISNDFHCATSAKLGVGFSNLRTILRDVISEL